MLVRFDKQERLYKAIKLVRPVHLNVSRTFEKMLEGAGITVAERAVLELICEAPVTVPEAARRLAMKRQFVQRVAAGLIRKGLVEKKPNPEHRRAGFCAPSPAGRDLFHGVHQRELEMLRGVLGDINQTEVVVALRVMTRIDTAFAVLARQAGEKEEGL
ncbi:DNA-binding MarR family transcriptional regulator [Sinorhizobium fredii]|jgi:DNA-binding MarR family transcriptional regulator|uniref:Putative transcriptional regulator, MarR family n=1 Tax=Sinorhizobium fredii (strain USDA 257) TaxID=1185652 RepID=I3XEH0_SINF2|nr:MULTISPECIES: helix-turn-helix domain-containing protein [Sinorhizobium]AFL54276.1 putative transcriptional regulator, MarR family [Sinorhizobium fredii USDA 257]PDT83460.1 MarR family transcriptional regulator [Sinorhizobium sp. BJ1]